MNESMRDHTSLGIGGRALYFVQVSSVEELNTVMAEARREKLTVNVIGGGTNILVSDSGIDGVVVQLLGGTFSELTVEAAVVTAGAGCGLAELVHAAADSGLAGLEGLVGIPGSVGGALWMNAGGRYGAIADHLDEVTVYAPESGAETRPARELTFGYRTSPFSRGEVILSARFALKEGTTEALRETMEQVLAEKRATQPLAARSCGCVFRNPAEQSAGALIDRCGLKGRREGDIEVSAQHANFFINTGRGSARDMVALMDRAYAEVRERFSVELEPEVVFIGDCGWKH